VPNTFQILKMDKAWYQAGIYKQIQEFSSLPENRIGKKLRWN